MRQYETERTLSWCYGVLTVALGLSVICIAIPYNHWRATLDVCPGGWLENTNCGCIFFGVSTHQYFNGGHNSYCLYSIFAPIPILVYSILMFLFHMYRVCINNVGKYDDQQLAATSMEELEAKAIVVTSRGRAQQKNDAVIYCWIPTSCIAAAFFIYSLVHASIVTHGFFRTCMQYRTHLVKILQASGDEASAIHFRLRCQAIFDYMDYLLKDPLNSRQGDYINTGASLGLGIGAAWTAVALLGIICVLTATRAFRERNVLTCCGK